MPKWGLTMNEGKVSRWFKNPGDPVREGEDLLEVETEKITNKVESPADGVLAHVLVPEGSTVDVGTLLAVIAEQGEDPEHIRSKYPEGTVEKIETRVEKTVSPKTGGVKQTKAFVPASPAARRLAAEMGIDLAVVKGTGSKGRITEADVTAFKEKKPDAPGITPLAREMANQEGIDIKTISGTGEGGKITKDDIKRALDAGKFETGKTPEASIPFTGMRKTIADNMFASLQNTAQLTVFTETDVTETTGFLELVREEYKSDATVKVSLNDIIIMAASRALKRHPLMNSTLLDREILLHESVNMGIAVSLDQGLIVPVLHEADRKGLLQIAGESRELARKAREGSLQVDDVTGGTFTISNVSMLNVDGFTPILRPPETGILGVGRVREKPAVFEGKIAVRAMMFLSLTFDHRVLDGVPAMAFLETVARYLEKPALIMAA
jgi:pyruvate dehydrogenase E2 component (dihydrolipoamide acetyltransferase)